MKNIVAYTDGGCKPNPGAGAFCTILLYNGRKKVLARYDPQTTNNQMELRAIITALNVLKERCNVTIYSDSEYIVNAINKGWARKWRKNNWMRSAKEPAKNPELFDRLLNLIDYHGKVELIWVRGHSGNKFNEECDGVCSKVREQQLGTYSVLLDENDKIPILL